MLVFGISHFDFPRFTPVRKGLLPHGSFPELPPGPLQHVPSAFLAKPCDVTAAIAFQAGGALVDFAFAGFEFFPVPRDNVPHALFKPFSATARAFVKDALQSGNLALDFGFG
jgi:hypothetical protein